MTGEFRVEITEDTIGIYDGVVELVHWIESEWIEDPSVVISICNAIVLAYDDPGDLLYRLGRTFAHSRCSSCTREIEGAPRLHTCDGTFHCSYCYQEAVQQCSLC